MPSAGSIAIQTHTFARICSADGGAGWLTASANDGCHEQLAGLIWQHEEKVRRATHARRTF